MSQQQLVHHRAYCLDCTAKCETKNSPAWAHAHVRKQRHAVMLELGYRVSARELRARRVAALKAQAGTA